MAAFTESDYQAWLAKGLVVEPRQTVVTDSSWRPQTAAPQHPWAHKSRAGFRPDLDQFFRSRWEANLARFFKFTGQVYIYEPCEFHFPIEKGIRTYTPDFYLPEEDKFVEVKGFMDRKSKTKLNRFRKYYPNERLEIITRPFFQALERQGMARLIEGWE